MLRRVFREGLGHELHLLRCRCFCMVLVCAFCVGFCAGNREFFSPFSGSCVSSVFLSLPPPSLSFSSSFSSGGRPGFPFLSSLCLAGRLRISSSWTGQSSFLLAVLVSVSSLCPGRPPSAFPLSSSAFCPLSLFSLSLACKSLRQQKACDALRCSGLHACYPVTFSESTCLPGTVG